MEQSPRRPVEVAKPKPMTKRQIVWRIAPMTKRQIVWRIAPLHGMKNSVVRRVLDTIASKTQEELITTGKSLLVERVRLQIAHRPPKVEFQQCVFGKMCTIKARPSKYIVKAVVLPKFRRYVAYRAA